VKFGRWRATVLGASLACVTAACGSGGDQPTQSGSPGTPTVHEAIITLRSGDNPTFQVTVSGAHSVRYAIGTPSTHCSYSLALVGPDRRPVILAAASGDGPIVLGPDGRPETPSASAPAPSGTADFDHAQTTGAVVVPLAVGAWSVTADTACPWTVSVGPAHP
jgi:hypothetical protein